MSWATWGLCKESLRTGVRWRSDVATHTRCVMDRGYTRLVMTVNHSFRPEVALMAERTLRGARLGGQSFEDDAALSSRLASRWATPARKDTCSRSRCRSRPTSLRSGSARVAAPLASAWTASAGGQDEKPARTTGTCSSSVAPSGAGGHPDRASRAAPRRRDRPGAPAPSGQQEAQGDRLSLRLRCPRRPHPRPPIHSVRGGVGSRPAPGARPPVGRRPARSAHGVPAVG